MAALKMCANVPKFQRKEEEEEREIERGKRDTLRGRGGYHSNVGVVPCLQPFSCHKHVGQTVTMPVASPNYSTIVLHNNSCISKAHEILKDLGSWTCWKWRNGSKGRGLWMYNKFNRLDYYYYYYYHRIKLRIITHWLELLFFLSNYLQWNSLPHHEVLLNPEVQSITVRLPYQCPHSVLDYCPNLIWTIFGRFTSCSSVADSFTVISHLLD